MQNRPHFFRPNLESLGDRIVPTTLPLGGSISLTTSLKGDVFTETVVYISPSGQTAKETGSFKIDYKTDSVSGTFDVVNSSGKVIATGTVTAQEVGGTELTGEVAVTGAGGKTFSKDFDITI